MPRATYHCTEIQMPSSVAECARLRRVVCRLAAAALRNTRAVADIELAVGEAFSNAVKYGGPGVVSIRVESPSVREVSIELAYPGRQFDTMVSCPQDVLNASGGFGRFIMNRVMDSMEYSFENGNTRLRMTKRS